MEPKPPPKPTTRPVPASAPRATTQAGTAIELTITEPKFTPPRIYLYTVEGWGKTTFGAYALKPAILMGGREDGYEVLKGLGQVPNSPCAKIESWDDFVATLSNIAKMDDPGFKSLVIDAVNGFTSLCNDKIKLRDYDNKKKKFENYKNGHDVVADEWNLALCQIERIHAKGIMIIFLDHVKASIVKNPMGDDYDSFGPDTYKYTTAHLKKWCDTVLFGKYETYVNKVDKDTGKGKALASSGTERVVLTQSNDAYAAKNRYHMPSEIKIPNDHTQVFNTIFNHIKPKK